MSTIRWSPTTAQLLNRESGSMFVGSPGSGKTFAMLNSAANCIGMGQRVIAIDPKNDFEKLKNVCNENLLVIKVKDSQPGALNPFTFLDSVDTPTLLTVIETLCGKLSPEQLNAITPIVQDFTMVYTKQDEECSMQDLANYLHSRDNKESQSVGTMLKIFEGSKLGELLFTRKKSKPMILSNTSSMVISLHGINLPEYDKSVDDYTPDERLVSAIVYLITTKLLSILSNKNKIPVLFVCDEAHILFGNKAMSSIIYRFLSLGRSLNVATILASQGISSFPNDISKYISSKFMFRNSVQEAEAFLDMFNTNKNGDGVQLSKNSVVSSIAKLEKGECFFIDMMNRSGFIKIVSNYDEKAFRSSALDV